MTANRRALTLVELVVSMAISTLLLVTVMGLTARLSRAANTIRQEHPTHCWKEILGEQLQTDYSSARSIIVDRNRIVMQTLVKSDDAVSKGNLNLKMPGVVIYTISTIENTNVLVRSARPFAGGVGEVSSSDFLASGIIEFETLTQLPTDVAPGTINLRVFETKSEHPITLSLVRHGMPE